MESFREVYQERKNEAGRRSVFRERYETRVYRELSRRWKRDKGRTIRRKNVKLALAKAYPVEFESYRIVASRIDTKYLERIEALGEKLSDLAKVTPFVPSASESCFASVYRGSFASQGWGQDRYYREALERAKRRAEYHGATARIDAETGYVYVNADSVGAELLRLKGPVPLREEVKQCWKNGVNPRVYMPFLPHGYEEREGLDYFGNETGAQR